MSDNTESQAETEAAASTEPAAEAVVETAVESGAGTSRRVAPRGDLTWSSQEE